MTTFWILAAGLMALAVLFAVLPLLRPAHADKAPTQDALNLEVFRQRLAELDADLASGVLDQGRYDSARHDLERELLYDLGDSDPGGSGKPAAPKPERPARAPWLAAALALAMPAGAIATYLHYGSPDILGRPQPVASAQGVPTHAVGPDGTGMPALEVLVERLAEKLKEHPDNLEGWTMLGRSYLAMHQSDKAVAAFEHAYSLAPKKADVALGYAEALATANGNRLSGRPAELIRAALASEPENSNALWLDGMLAFQEGRFADAVGTWERLLAGLEPNDRNVEDVRKLIAEARSRAGMPPAEHPPAVASTPGLGRRVLAEGTGGPSPTGANSGADSGQGAARIQVSVSLSPELASKASPGDSVFVYARAAAGPPMPLAARRLKVSDLPTTLTLDDSMAMMPAMRLSAFPQVLVGARISKSGQAMPQSGDLEGQIGPIGSAGSHEVSVVVDRVRP